MAPTWDSHAWATEQFGGCDFGDKRRTGRLIKVAEQIANNPSGSFPNQMEAWGDLKAAYRLFDSEEVTFERVAGGHWQQTRQCEPGRYLVISDTTELDFGFYRAVKGLGATGNGGGRGFLLHNALVVNAEARAIVGVAGQTIHYRATTPKRKRENDSQRLKRKRESEVWGRVIDMIGPAPNSVQWVHIMDRGGDNFEVYCHLLETQSDWVVRAGRMSRKIVTPSGDTMSLSEYLPMLQEFGSYELELRGRDGKPARKAKMQVMVGKVTLPVPIHTSPYVKSLAASPIEMAVVWVREIDAPSGVEPIEWVLYTSLKVETFQDAWTVVEYYESRWLVEEYHKALKSGCQVTTRQLREATRLEAMVGLMSVVAVRLLQLKSAARSDPDRPAKLTVPPLWLSMLKVARKGLKGVYDLTIYQFYRELAKLGGFLGRKGDGEPGWITIWRGWEKLNNLVRGAELAIQLRAEVQKCG